MTKQTQHLKSEVTFTVNVLVCVCVCLCVCVCVCLIFSPPLLGHFAACPHHKNNHIQ